MYLEIINIAHQFNHCWCFLKVTVPTAESRRRPPIPVTTVTNLQRVIVASVDSQSIASRRPATPVRPVPTKPRNAPSAASAIW